MKAAVTPLLWTDRELRILDQRVLPLREIWIHAKNYETVARAIESLAIRGAPVIGIAAGYGVALAALEHGPRTARLQAAVERLRNTRPTGFNLFHVLDTLSELIQKGGRDLQHNIVQRAIKFHHDDARSCLIMAKHGVSLMNTDENVLTYCNTGALATGGIGTALGVIKHGWTRKKVSGVFACETRPVAQGARLTVWECSKANIPVTLICDNMVAALLSTGKIARVFVGADRIARNGDTSNKIGTLQLAILARYFHIPFHVVAPLTTFDTTLRSGKGIPIEQRSAAEILKSVPGLERLKDVRVWNPAFDVAPARLITSYVTDHGVIRPPFEF